MKLRELVIQSVREPNTPTRVRALMDAVRDHFPLNEAPAVWVGQLRHLRDEAERFERAFQKVLDLELAEPATVGAVHDPRD